MFSFLFLKPQVREAVGQEQVTWSESPMGNIALGLVYLSWREGLQRAPAQQGPESLDLKVLVGLGSRLRGEVDRHSGWRPGPCEGSRERPGHGTRRGPVGRYKGGWEDTFPLLGGLWDE